MHICMYHVHMQFPDMQPTILEFILHEPPLTDTIGTQTDQPLDPEKPLYAGWLKKFGMQNFVIGFLFALCNYMPDSWI